MNGPSFDVSGKENQELRMEKEILRKATAFFGQGKSMRFAFIDVEKASYPMRVLCRVLEVSRSGYYAWRFRKPSSRNLEDERLRPKIVEAFKTGRGTYGKPARAVRTRRPGLRDRAGSEWRD